MGSRGRIARPGSGIARPGSGIARPGSRVARPRRREAQASHRQPVDHRPRPTGRDRGPRLTRIHCASRTTAFHPPVVHDHWWSVDSRDPNPRNSWTSPLCCILARGIVGLARRGQLVTTQQPRSHQGGRRGSGRVLSGHYCVRDPAGALAARWCRSWRDCTVACPARVGCPLAKPVEGAVVTQETRSRVAGAAARCARGRGPRPALLPAAAGLVLGIRPRRHSPGARLSSRSQFPFSQLPGWPAASARRDTQAGSCRSLEGVPVGCLQGRLHMYEGLTALGG